MKPIHTFTVVPSLPPSLERLRELAYNLRWSWNHETISLFRRLDDDLWQATGHNPVLMLGKIDQIRLEEAASDESFLAHLERVCADFDAYMANQSTWFQRAHGPVQTPLIAYFSAEFGLTECLSIFAGGLGILAGDHLKSASDLGIPLVGVGLLYQQGYFRQRLNASGWQQELYEDNDFFNLPVRLERQPDGTPYTVELGFPGRKVTAQIWRAQVGRTPLFLLDTNIPANRPEDRDITDQLYGGDLEMRIQQELVLGIGGYRALQALGIEPSVYHMNEGHSAFLALEHTRRFMESQHFTFAEAKEAAAPGLVFTTHTPVSAGQDYFPPDLMDRYLGGYLRELGLTRQAGIALGRQNPDDENEPFCMTILALHMSAVSNGVSRLHGQVTRKMWEELWPGVPEEEIPIGYVTNGVHYPSWLSDEMDQLYDRYLSPRWREEPADEMIWQRAKHIPADELWRTHERRRERMIAYARQRLQNQLRRRGALNAEIDAANEVLDSGALTIGFARRFATYKRATLLLRDPERLGRILNDPERPVQIIFAGKAHPQDEAGKDLIREIVNLSRQEPFRRWMIFLEDYDTEMARYLVQGADVWLNTPRRPLEASGTSGMKAAANGVLNLSILDGWWDEAWQDVNQEFESIGWAIGNGGAYSSPEEQDQIESEWLYSLLEQEIIPTFYERGSTGLPRQWIRRMQFSISSLSSSFNTHRTVREYTERFYLPAITRSQQLSLEGFAPIRSYSAWKEKVHAAWPQVRVTALGGESLAKLQVGTQMHIRALVFLGSLAPEDVRVELYLGRLDARGEINGGVISLMDLVGPQGNRYLFEAETVPCHQSGLHGYTVRVLPQHPELTGKFIPGLITWAESVE